MNNGRSIIVLGLMGAVLLLCYLEPAVRWRFWPPKQNEKLLTKLFLKNLDESIAYLERLNGTTAKDWLGPNVSRSRAINAQLVTLFAARKLSTGVPVSTNGQKLFVDGWGRPLQFLTSDAPEVTNLYPEIRRQERRLYFWSTGADAKNNWGSNDDVFVAQRAPPQPQTSEPAIWHESSYNILFPETNRPEVNPFKSPQH